MTAGPGIEALLPLAPYLVSASISAGIALAAMKRRSLPLVRSFVLVLWMEFAWTALLVFETLSPTLAGKIFWDNLQFPVSLGAGAVFYLFARRATDRPRPSNARIALLLMPALVSALLSFTDPAHALIRTASFIDASVAFGELVYGFTWLDYLLFALPYALMVLSIGILVRSAVEAPRIDRTKYALVILAFVLPTFGIMLSILGVRVFGRRDGSPIWFSLGNPLIVVALFRFNLFDILPIARRAIVDSLGDPLVMFDDDGLVLDCNRAFARIIGIAPRSVRGRRLQEVLASWPEVVAILLDPSCSSWPGREDLTATSPRGGDTYRISVAPIAGEEREPRTRLCVIAIFRDITELAAVRGQLLSWNAELEGKISARLHDLEQEVARRKAAEEGLRRVGATIVKSQKEILVTLSEVVENRSPETANHVLRVQEYARILAAAYGLSAEGISLIVDAAPLHDVGKIAIPDAILNKPDRLTTVEMEVMKTHSTIGFRILGNSDRSIIRAAAIIALDHHERWNGEGYPSGKKGEAISLSGRIVCLCDVYDALATTRSYKEPWERTRILEYFASESGRMFDPGLVDLLLANADRFREISERFPESSMEFSRFRA